jgi:hypothetical protein
VTREIVRREDTAEGPFGDSVVYNTDGPVVDEKRALTSALRPSVCVLRRGRCVLLRRLLTHTVLERGSGQR